MVQNYNNVQFNAMNPQNENGITLVYVSTNTKGVTTETATHFSGNEFVPLSKERKDVFKAWKAVMSCFWNAKIIEAGLRIDNAGIKIKLKSGCPARIYIKSPEMQKPLGFNISESIWSRIGLIPTKKAMLEREYNYKRKIHKAAEASFHALKIGVGFDCLKRAAAEVERFEDEAEKAEA